LYRCAVPCCAVPQTDEGEETLYCCYVPTNHVYVGDIFLLGDKDIIRNNLSGRRCRGSGEEPWWVVGGGWS